MHWLLWTAFCKVFQERGEPRKGMAELPMEIKEDRERVQKFDGSQTPPIFRGAYIAKITMNMHWKCLLRLKITSSASREVDIVGCVEGQLLNGHGDDG